MKSITTEEFLKLFPNTVFQWFYDPDSTQKEPGTSPKFEVNKLRDLNKERFGIYFTPNAFDKRRVEDKLTKLQAVFCDMDVNKEGSKQKLVDVTEAKRLLWKALTNLNLKPNVIIVTKNGLQPLWLIDEEKIDDLTKEQYRNVIKGIIAWSKEYGNLGDHVHDIPRVLRLPGFDHCKSEERFPIIAHLLHEKKYTLLQLAKLFPYFDEAKITDDDAKVYQDLRTIDSLDFTEIVLAALSEYGEPNARFDEKGRLWISRGVTGAFIGKRDTRQYIGSTSHEIPHGNAITFVRRLLKLPDNKEAYRWIRDHFGLSTKKAVSISPVIPIGLRKTEVSNTKHFTGFKMLDEKIGGFRGGNIYLVAGLEKSGKSSLVMTWANKFLESTKVGYINTELPDKEFTDRMAANYTGIPYSEVEKRKDEVDKWIRDKSENLLYAGINDISQDGIRNLEKALLYAKEFANNQAKILIIDNLTTFSLGLEQRDGWRITGYAVSKLDNIAKTSDVTIFFIIHTKPDIVYTETPEGIKELLKSGHPEKIFSESYTIVRKPTLKDVYGGGQSLSQISGAVLLWLPYQKKEDTFFYKPMARLLLDSFRHTAGGGQIPVVFQGEKYRFSEDYSTLPPSSEVEEKPQPPEEDSEGFIDGERIIEDL